MRLYHVLIVSLLAIALSAGAMIADLLQRLRNSNDGNTAEIVYGSGVPYVVILVVIACAALIAVLLIRNAVREERAQAIRKLLGEPHKPAVAIPTPTPTAPTAPPAPAPTTATASAGDAPTATSGATASVSAEPGAKPEPATATAPAKEPWGRVQAWSSDFAEPVRKLWNEHAAGLYQAAPREAPEFQKFLSAPEFDATASALAIASDGQLLGALLALRFPAFEDDGFWWLEAPGAIAGLLVDPAARRKGIGSALVKHFESAAARGKRPRAFVGGLENFPHLVAGVPESDAAARIFFASHGYREVRRTCHMEARCEGYTPPEELIEREAALKIKGYTFTAALAGDAEQFKALIETGSLDKPQRRLEKFITEPNRYYWVRKDERLVGFLQVSTKDAKGLSGITQIFFLREHRGVGLGSVLLIKAHELWRGMEAQGAWIWTYPEAAERFYPRAGFKVVQEWLCLSKDLPHDWTDKGFVDRFR